MNEKSLPLIFLDFDGVLNSSTFFTTPSTNGKPKGNFDPECIKRLNEITDATDAAIILTTSWRNEKDIFKLCKNIGIKGKIVGRTPNLEYSTIKGLIRGNEIAHWLIENNLDPYDYPYIIIDDCDDILAYQSKNLVLTNYVEGLTEEKKNEAIEKLKTLC